MGALADDGDYTNGIDSRPSPLRHMGDMVELMDLVCVFVDHALVDSEGSGYVARATLMHLAFLTNGYTVTLTLSCS